jgi:hypothetical protein
MRVLKPGQKLKSAVCDTQVIVIRAAPGEHDVRCGGAAMVDGSAPQDQLGAVDAARAAGSLIGKRYVDEAEAFEFLCVKGGEGSLELDGAPLLPKQAKALPSSD